MQKVNKEKTIKQHALLSNTGVTILELLAVVLIIAILSLVSTPVFRSFGKSARLENAAEGIATVLKMARAMAVASGAVYKVEINTATAQLRIYQDANGNGSLDLSELADKAYSAPAGILIPDVSGSTGGSVPDLTFNPGSTTSNARSIHIIARGTTIAGSAYDPTSDYSAQPPEERVKCYTVTTNSTTARARIYRYGRNTPWSSSWISS